MRWDPSPGTFWNRHCHGDREQIGAGEGREGRGGEHRRLEGSGAIPQDAVMVDTRQDTFGKTHTVFALRANRDRKQGCAGRGANTLSPDAGLALLGGRGAPKSGTVWKHCASKQVGGGPDATPDPTQSAGPTLLAYFPPSDSQTPQVSVRRGGAGRGE